MESDVTKSSWHYQIRDTALGYSLSASALDNKRVQVSPDISLCAVCTGAQPMQQRRRTTSDQKSPRTIWSGHYGTKSNSGTPPACMHAHKKTSEFLNNQRQYRYISDSNYDSCRSGRRVPVQRIKTRQSDFRTTNETFVPNEKLNQVPTLEVAISTRSQREQILVHEWTFLRRVNVNRTGQSRKTKHTCM